MYRKANPNLPAEQVAAAINQHVDWQKKTLFMANMDRLIPFSDAMLRDAGGAWKAMQWNPKQAATGLATISLMTVIQELIFTARNPEYRGQRVMVRASRINIPTTNHAIRRDDNYVIPSIAIPLDIVGKPSMLVRPLTILLTDMLINKLIEEGHQHNSEYGLTPEDNWVHRTFGVQSYGVSDDWKTFIKDSLSSLTMSYGMTVNPFITALVLNATGENIATGVNYSLPGYEHKPLSVAYDPTKVQPVSEAIGDITNGFISAPVADTILGPFFFSTIFAGLGRVSGATEWHKSSQIEDNDAMWEKAANTPGLQRIVKLNRLTTSDGNLYWDIREGDELIIKHLYRPLAEIRKDWVRGNLTIATDNLLDLYKAQPSKVLKATLVTTFQSMLRYSILKEAIDHTTRDDLITRAQFIDNFNRFKVFRTGINPQVQAKAFYEGLDMCHGDKAKAHYIIMASNMGLVTRNMAYELKKIPGAYEEVKKAAKLVPLVRPEIEQYLRTQARQRIMEFKIGAKKYSIAPDLSGKWYD